MCSHRRDAPDAHGLAAGGSGDARGERHRKLASAAGATFILAVSAFFFWLCAGAPL